MASIKWLERKREKQPMLSVGMEHCDNESVDLSAKHFPFQKAMKCINCTSNSLFTITTSHSYIDTTEKHISLLDFMLIMLCSGKRQGKVTPELSKKSFCFTKGIYYFGMKLHAGAFRRKGKLPLPEYLYLFSAAENDLEAIHPTLSNLVNRTLSADKAYADKGLNEDLLKNANTCIYTPVKLVKRENDTIRKFKKAADTLFSTAVSVV